MILVCCLHSRSRSYCMTDSQSVCLGVEHPCGTCDQILLSVGMLLCEICLLVSVECPLWREDGSAICSAITQWSESLRARNHTLLSHLRLPQLGRQDSRIYIPQEQGGPVIPPGIGFPLRRLLRLARVIITLSQPGGPGPRMYIPQEQNGPVQSQSHVTTDGQSISMSWCLVHAALSALIVSTAASISSGFACKFRFKIFTNTSEY
jgi:hypothetical protein